MINIDRAIARLHRKEDLSEKEIRRAFDMIMQGRVSIGKTASLLSALAEKGESVKEIAAAAESLKSKMIRLTPNVQDPLLDIVGTGGDNRNSFNISTAAAFVAAGSGCFVAKHGNRSFSGKSGAADVLEKIGVRIDCSCEKSIELIEKIGIAFLFAPFYHPAVKHAMAARKQLKIRTIFNLIGPLINPASPWTILLGASDLLLAKKLALVLAGQKISHALVVFGGGFDEISLTSNTTIFEVWHGAVTKSEITPEQFGFSRCSDIDLEINSVDEAAATLEGILDGRIKGPKRDVVTLNAGAAIYVNGKALSIEEGIEKARQSIDQGAAFLKLRQLIQESNK